VTFFFRQLTRSFELSQIFLPVLTYTGIGILSLLCAYALRFDFHVNEEFQALFVKNVLLVVPLKLAFLAFFGQFGTVLRYFRLPDLYKVLWALLGTAVVLSIGWYFFKINPLPPRGVILGDFVFSLLFIVAFRTGLRIAYEQTGQPESAGSASATVRVGIVGAGDMGASIAADMLAKRTLGMRPVLFLDDAPEKQGRKIHGIPVVGGLDAVESHLLQHEVNKVVLALPPEAHNRVRGIVEQTIKLGLQIEIPPDYRNLSAGAVKANRLRPVEIEDLLGRAPVALDDTGIEEMLRGRVILVTGAGGSIGTELCRQILRRHPARLLMLDQAELPLFHLNRNLQEFSAGGQVYSLVGNILDGPRMDYLLKRFRPEIIFHAAAHKHVGIMETQPCEALKNNTFGTMQLADLAAANGVQRFILISTDKAINPTSVMGASKRLAEVYLQAKNQTDCLTQFMAVRFGNVLGSSGSVIPIFRQQIASGGPLTVTHPDVTRFFMTLSEAVGLVLQSVLLARGGEIFVLDMGSPVKIMDLAQTMVRLSGLRPGIDIEIKIIGLQPGEKLFEELQHNDERNLPTTHPQIMNFASEPIDRERLFSELEKLRRQMDLMERNLLKQHIQKLIPEYQPFLD
jgi:FlaA1/EpsC-like NDP-sugar epimerase